MPRSSRYGDDDVAVLRRGLENARAVREPALRVRQVDNAARVALEDLDADDRLADVLPVRADVLDRRRAGGAGDAGEALDAGPSAGDGEVDEVVPPLARGDVDDDGLRVLALDGDAAQVDVDDHAVEAVVGDEHVRPAGQHEQRQFFRGGEGQRLAHVVDGLGADEELRRAADAEGGERS
jgi:hypothetical protein